MESIIDSITMAISKITGDNVSLDVMDFIWLIAAFVLAIIGIKVIGKVIKVILFILVIVVILFFLVTSGIIPI